MRTEEEILAAIERLKGYQQGYKDGGFTLMEKATGAQIFILEWVLNDKGCYIGI
jgi:hypothetical protein